ncbi:MAG: hypothetical protein Q8M17_02210 [Actinomycetota bacterium]|nr:hypothetical protein [Actinomycetota bacterium]
MSTRQGLAVAGLVAAIALVVPLVVAGGTTAAAAMPAVPMQVAAEGDDHANHDGMSDAEMADMGSEGESGHAPGSPVVATPDEAGRNVVLAGFAAMNVLVLVMAGLLRRTGRGVGRRRPPGRVGRGIHTEMSSAGGQS